MAGKRLEQRLTVDGRKETGAEVVVEVLVPTHVIDPLPLCVGHLSLDDLWGHLVLPPHVQAPVLQVTQICHQHINFPSPHLCQHVQCVTGCYRFNLLMVRTPEPTQVPFMTRTHKLFRQFT